MKITAKDLAQLVNGTILGDETASVSRPGKIEDGEPGTICFLGNPKYENFAYTTKASILLVANDFIPQHPISATLIKVESVYTALSILMEKFGQAAQKQEATISKMVNIHPSAKIGNQVTISDFVVIEEGAVIGDNVRIMPNAYIAKNVIIGDDTVLHSGVKTYPDTKIGSRCIIHAGVVIGSDGLGFVPQPDKTLKKIIHLGDVVIEDDVEIGANCTIDKGSIGSTIIRRGVKLDNLVHVAHNVEIGTDTIIAAGCAFAGSVKIGSNCMIGGQVGVAGHLKLGDRTQIQAQSGIGKSTAPDSKWYGSPAIPYSDYLKSYILFRNLPALAKKINDLEKKND
jgi:UDP-3-O-[3-hydroxymyristoyl] glucosamine N-acyltransferase